MNRFISLLRGINVSGQKKIKMADLKKLYEELGFHNVQTYIQSGNVIFNHSQKDISQHIAAIENGIKDHYGFDVKIIIRTPHDFHDIIKNEPFGLDTDQLKRLYITFLAETGDPGKLIELEKYKTAGDRYHLKGNHLYFYCPGGYGNTKLSNNTIERVLGISASTRNWNSVCKLYELAEK